MSETEKVDSFAALKKALRAAEDFDDADAAFVVDKLITRFFLHETANYTITVKRRTTD